MDSIFLMIVFLKAFLFVVIVANIVTVGNYTDLNPRSCGLSSISSKPNKNCFQWHKDVLAPMKGKDPVNLTLGDAPWVALLYVDHGLMGGYCSGSVIADEWILTAAHCVVPKLDEFGNETELTSVKIYLGYDFHHDNVSGERPYNAVLPAYVHPGYDLIDGQFNVYDLALIKMDVSINNTNNRFIENSICLPEKWSHTDCMNDTTKQTPCLEYAMVGGWGPGNFTDPNPLKMGYWIIRNERTSFIANETEFASMFNMKSVGNHYICGGDSGGPVWQYDLGRAVIVGVISEAETIKGYEWTECDMGSNETYVFATWVDQEIAWIQSVTGQH